MQIHTHTHTLYTKGEQVTNKKILPVKHDSSLLSGKQPCRLIFTTVCIIVMDKHAPCFLCLIDIDIDLI